jgi:hypothetical protein
MQDVDQDPWPFAGRWPTGNIWTQGPTLLTSPPIVRIMFLYVSLISSRPPKQRSSGTKQPLFVRVVIRARVVNND